jgi:hypothetical protein
MADSAYYRIEALRLIKWAETASDPAIARRWRRLADDYVTLAEQLDAKEGTRPPLLRMPMQAQPVQQQQGKLGRDESADC